VIGDGLSEENSGFRLQSRRVKQARNQHKACKKVELFDPKDGGDMLLRNLVSRSRHYKALRPQNTTL
jgi:hypothetical protein